MSACLLAGLSAYLLASLLAGLSAYLLACLLAARCKPIASVGWEAEVRAGRLGEPRRAIRSNCTPTALGLALVVAVRVGLENREVRTGAVLQIVQGKVWAQAALARVRLTTLRAPPGAFLAGEVSGCLVKPCAVHGGRARVVAVILVKEGSLLAGRAVGI